MTVTLKCGGRGHGHFFSFSDGVFLGDDVNDRRVGWPLNSSFSRADVSAHGCTSRWF